MSAEILAQFDAVIDVRSPAEYEEDHIPGALSAPVLDNEERVRVGTVYKQVSHFDAKKIGAALVSKNIAKHMEQRFAAMPLDWKPLVYCWRGGKRSGAFAHVLREIGWDAWSIDGGYKAYRRFLIDDLATLPGHYSFRVIHGPTGSGKSRLLRSIREAGAQVLDLEDLAAHRGSVLGTLPDRPQPAQKLFETLIWDGLRKSDPSRPVYVEGESKKIGQLQIPESLMHAMRSSECVLVDASRETRIALLLDEYRHFFADTNSLYAQLDCLRGLYGEEVIGRWKALAAQGNWPALVASLLDDHYDPAYSRSALRNYVQLPKAHKIKLASPAGETFDTGAFDAIARELVEQRHLEAA